MVVKTALVITCVALLASCGPKPDLTECNGWVGPVLTEQDFARAAAAEKRGRELCNAKLRVAQKYYAWGG